MRSSGWFRFRFFVYALACVVGAAHATLRKDYWENLHRSFPGFPWLVAAMALLFGFPFIVFILCGPCMVFRSRPKMDLVVISPIRRLLCVAFQWQPKPEAPTVFECPFDWNDPRYFFHFIAHLAIAEGTGFLVAAAWTKTAWAWLGGILIGSGLALLVVVRLLGSIYKKWCSNRS